MTRVLAACILVSLSRGVCRAQDFSIMRSIRECLRANSSLVCLKERALKVIDEAVVSDQPIKLLDYVDVIRDPAYKVNITDETVLPYDTEERSMKLNDLITRRVDQFFESRTVKFNLANVFEGRKKGGKKGGGLLMMGGLAMAGMMAQMFMGKVAFMAGAALMISKMALLLSSIIGLKKLVGGGGGGDHVVYTASDSHGGGGWHRSLHPEDEPGVLAYRAHNTNNNNV